MTDLATQHGKEFALEALRKRREGKPTPIENSALPAGSPMYYYCISCGHLAGVLPEDHLRAIPQFCSECAALKACGWLE